MRRVSEPGNEYTDEGKHVADLQRAYHFKTVHEADYEKADHEVRKVIQSQIRINGSSRHG